MLTIRLKGCSLSYIPPFDMTPYIESEETKSIDAEFAKVLIDNNGNILCGKKYNGTIIDNSSIVGSATASDGTLITTLIRAYKKTL